MNEEYYLKFKDQENPGKFLYLGYIDGDIICQDVNCQEFYCRHVYSVVKYKKIREEFFIRGFEITKEIIKKIKTNYLRKKLHEDYSTKKP